MVSLRRFSLAKPHMSRTMVVVSYLLNTIISTVSLLGQDKNISIFNKDSTLKNKERRTFIKHIVNDKRVRAVIKETSLIGKRNILIGKLIMFHQIDLLYIIAKLSRTSF